jgi:hypothetical protein
MPSIIEKTILSEPSRGAHTVMFFFFSLVFLGIYLYFDVLGHSSSPSAGILSIGFALSGIAECLPTHRRRTAGLFRVTAVLLLLSLIATNILELIG